MERISHENRRRILDLKLRGFSNQEAAEECGVSKGTVANVLEEVRAGQLVPVEGLEAQIDGLLTLAKRVDEAELSVSDAHLGLDVLAWLAGLGIEPDQIAAFRDRLSELADGEIAIEDYGSAAVRLRSVERATGYRFDGQIQAVLDLLDRYGEAEIKQLVTAATKAQELGVTGEEMGQAIDNAIRLRDQGFDLDVATAISEELGHIEDDGSSAAIEELRSVYEEFSALRSQVDALEADRDTLREEVEELRSTRANHEAERDLLQETIEQFDRTLTTHSEALKQLEMTRESLQDDIDHRRDRLTDLEASIEEAEADLDSIEEERAVVHAYRRFLREQDVSSDLLRDLTRLREIREGTSDPYPGEEKQLEANVKAELVKQAKEMFDSESMITVAEHERKLQDAIEADRTLDDLQLERDSVGAFLDFITLDDLSEQVLKDLYRMKRGLDPHVVRKEQKMEEVRGYLRERLTAFTDGVEVVAKPRHDAAMREQRQQYLTLITQAFSSLNVLSHRIEVLQSALDEEWMTSVAQNVASHLETEGGPPAEAVRAALAAELSQEVEARVDQAIEERVTGRLAQLEPSGLKTNETPEDRLSEDEKDAGSVN